MTDYQVGITAAILGVYGTARLLHDGYRVVRALGQATVGAGKWIASRLRSWSFARERRRVQRQEGVAALATETAATLATVVADLRAEIAELRATREPSVVVDHTLITAANCGAGRPPRFTGS